jgi:thioredoxin-like negative regulator of GroEL
VLERWLQEHAGDLVVRNALGDAQLMTGRLAAARASYEQVLQQAPQANAVRNNLANVLLRLNDPGALALAEQALALEPQNAEMLDTAGWAAFKAGKAERGLQLMRQARQRDAASPAIRYHLAAVLVAAGRQDEARNELTAALQPGRGFQERAEAETLLRTLR